MDGEESWWVDIERVFEDEQQQVFNGTEGKVPFEGWAQYITKTLVLFSIL